MFKRTFATAATTMIALSVGTLLTPAAIAATPSQSQTCWQELDSGRSLCVDATRNIADAVLDEFDIVISTPDGVVAPSDEVSDKRSPAPAVVTTTASTVVGVFYENSNYGGASFVASVSQNGCYGYAHGYTNLGSFGWNDRISSFRSYSNCRTSIFESSNYGGASYGYYYNSTNVGNALNDRASSIRWAA